MNLVIIFYFSGTGNTWWIAKTIAEKLRAEGISTQLVSIESEKLDDYIDEIEDYDRVGFGYPVYGSDCPDNYWKFINNLPSVERKDCFIFTSMMAFSGDGALVTEKRLNGKGYNLRQAVNYVMPNNLKLPYPVIDLFPIYDEEDSRKIREKAEKKIGVMVDRIITGTKMIEGRGILGIIGGLSQRILVSYLGWTRWVRNFFIDYDACIDCMQCVEHCPKGNISKEKGKFVWGEKCVCCIRCYSLCPTDAIQYKEATLNKKKFPRYKGPTPEFSVGDLYSE